MAEPIQIVINVDASQAPAAVQQVTDALEGMGKASQQSGQALDQTKQSTDSFAKSATEAWSTIQAWTASLNAAGGLIDSEARLGESVLRSKAALDSLTGGGGDAYMSRLSAATRGTVDNLTLAHDATLMLSSGLADNADQAAKIAAIGSTLGSVYMNDAAGGVTAFMNSMETGSTRGLKTLGINIAAVKDEAEKLKKSGLDAGDAMRQAMEDQGAAAVAKLDAKVVDATDQWDKFTTHLTDTSQDWASKFATSVNGIGSTLDLLNNKTIDINVVMHSAASEAGTPGTDLNNALAVIMGVIAPGSQPIITSGALNPNLRGFSGNPWGAPGSPLYGPPESAADTAAALDAERQQAYLQAAANVPARSRRELQQQDDWALADSTMLTGRRPVNWSDYYTAQALGMDAQGPNARAMAWGAGGISAGDLRTRDFNETAQLNNVSAGMGLQGPNAIAAQLLPDTMKQTAEVMKQANDAAGSFDMTLAALSNNAHGFVANFQSLAQAFGTGSGGIGGQIEGGLTGAIAQRRAQLVKQGMGAGDLAAFDDTAKRNMEQYQIAIGQATPDSINFANAQESVNKAFEKGQISLDQATQKYLALAQAAKEGRTAASDIDAILAGVPSNPDFTPIHAKGGHFAEDQGPAGKAAGAGTAAPKTPDGKGLDSMYDPVLVAQKKVQDGNTAIGTTYQAAIPVVAKSADQHAAALTPAFDRTNALIKLQSQLRQALGSWTGTYTVQLQVGYAPGGGAGSQGGG